MSLEGKEEDIVMGWEGRQGCAYIWGKKKVDAVLLKYAQFHEGNYRAAGGKHSSEEREISPFPVPSEASSRGNSQELEKTNEEKAAEEKKAEEKKAAEEAKAAEEKKAKDKKAAEEAAMAAKPTEPTIADIKAFKPKYRMIEGIGPEVTLTPTQKGDLVDAFDSYWKKKHPILIE